MYDKPVKIFLGGPPGAGKTFLTEYLVSQGWNGVGLDSKGSGQVSELVDAPTDHPAFQQTPLVVEGGFLDEAPRFQELVERLDLTTFWLTGSRSQLVDSRLNRMSSWDNAHQIRNSNWIELVERHRVHVRWDYQIQMWRPDRSRKTLSEVLYEIESCVLTGMHLSAPENYT